MRAEVWGWHNIAWLLAAFSWHRERAFKALVRQRLAAAVLAQAHALMLQRPEEPVWVDPDEPLDYTNLIGPTFQIRVENLYDITARITGWVPAVVPEPGQPAPPAEDVVFIQIVTAGFGPDADWAIADDDDEGANARPRSRSR